MTTAPEVGREGAEAWPRWLKRVDRVLDCADSLLLGLVMVFLVLLTSIIALLVLDRSFGLPFSTGWVSELSNYVMAYCAFLPASWILKQRGHVALDLVYERLPDRGQTVALWVGGFLSIVTCAVLSYFAWGVVIDSFERELVLRGGIDMPRYLVFLPVAVGLTMLTFRLLRDAVVMAIGERPVLQTKLEEA